MRHRRKSDFARNLERAWRSKKTAWILALILIGSVVFVALSSAGEPPLEGLMRVEAGIYQDKQGGYWPYVKYIKTGEPGYFLAILDSDASEVIAVVRIIGKTQYVVWPKDDEEEPRT